MGKVSRPLDMPAAEAFEHGTHARYTSGCRCDACRAARTRVAQERGRRALEAALELAPAPAGPVTKIKNGRLCRFARGCPGVEGAPCPSGSYLRKDSKGGVCRACRERLVWNGLVDASAVRRHLRKLARQGVGRRAVADAADVSPSTLSDIRRGVRDKLRRELERRILAVTAEAVADGAHVPAAPTIKLLDELVARGFTKTELAHELGHEGLAYYRRSKVTARTELEVRRLYRRLADREPRRRRAFYCVCERRLELVRDGVVLCGRCERPVREAKAG